MARELLQDKAAAVVFYPSSIRARPSSATLDFVTPGNNSKATPTVTLSAVGSGGSAAVASVTSQAEIVVDDATGFIPGGAVWCETADGWKGSVRVAEVSGTTVILEAAAPGTLTTSTVFYGLGLSATIPSSATGTRDRFYRLEWLVTDADGAVTLLHEIAHVVRMQFADPMTEGEAKRYVAANWPGAAAGKDAGWFRGITRRANARVRVVIQGTGDFPHMIGDPDAFVSSGAGLAALRLELAHEALTPGDFSPAEYIDSTERDLKGSVRAAMANAFVDRGDTGTVDAGDVRGVWTIRAVRL